MGGVRGGPPVSLHRSLAGLTVAAVGPRAQADEGRQAVAQRDVVGPEAVVSSGFELARQQFVVRPEPSIQSE